MLAASGSYGVASPSGTGEGDGGAPEITITVPPANGNSYTREELELINKKRKSGIIVRIPSLYWEFRYVDPILDMFEYDPRTALKLLNGAVSVEKNDDEAEFKRYRKYVRKTIRKIRELIKIAEKVGSKAQLAILWGKILRGAQAADDLARLLGSRYERRH
jgi:hypothetical protein